MLFGTADFARPYAPTGVPGAEAALHSGSYLRQQWAGLRGLWRALGRPALANPHRRGAG
jgi:hypothetical protein